MRKYFYLAAIFLVLPAFALAATLVNINTASVDELDTLPGIGPTKATAIVEYRVTNGPFKSIEDIDNVKGIGPSIFAEIKSLITVGEQPVTPVSSFNSKPKVETVPVTKTTAPVYAVETANKEVSAPAPVADATGAGASVSEPTTRATSFWSSPWTVGVLVLVVFAGGVLMII